MNINMAALNGVLKKSIFVLYAYFAIYGPGCLASLLMPAKSQVLCYNNTNTNMNNIIDKAT